METKDAMATNRTKCNPRGFGFIWNMYGLVFMNNRYSNTVVFRQNTNCTYSSHNHLLFLFFFRPISKKNSVSYDYHYSVFRTNAGFLHFLIIWMRRTDTNSNLNTVNEVSESWLCINPLWMNQWRSKYWFTTNCFIILREEKISLLVRINQALNFTLKTEIMDKIDTCTR